MNGDDPAVLDPEDRRHDLPTGAFFGVERPPLRVFLGHNDVTSVEPASRPKPDVGAVDPFLDEWCPASTPARASHLNVLVEQTLQCIHVAGIQRGVEGVDKLDL